MKLIIITAPSFLPDEAKALELLLANGLDRLHLRKPECTADELEQLIRQIPPAYYARISLHDHFHLQAPFGLGGIHLNRRNPQAPSGYRGLVSRSFHTLEEISQSGTQTDYHFLSPIFDSISKQGYAAHFTTEQLRQASAQGIITQRTIALGGITQHHLPLLQELGFGGAALLGDIWRNYHSPRDLDSMLQHFLELEDCIKNIQTGS